MAAAVRAKKPVSVHFASETAMCPPSMPRDSDKSDISPTSTLSHCLPAVAAEAAVPVVGHSEKLDSNYHSDSQDDDDDDDDW